MAPLGTSFCVKREAFLERLQQAFVEHQLVIVAGRSGIGKTTLLKEYVRRSSQQYQSILWFNAATDEAFLADLIAALQSYALPIDIAQGAAQLFHTLQQHLDGQQVLLIIENFSHTFSLQGVSERQPGLHTIMSTHAPQTPAQLPRLELTGLSAQDGAALLHHHAGLTTLEEDVDMEADETQRAALELSDEVHGLPITLNLIGRYLHMTGESAREYLAAFRAYPASVYQSNSMDQSAMKEFASACERSLTFLKEKYPAAFELLQILALHFPEGIPTALFQSPKKPSAAATDVEPSLGQLLVDAGFITADEQTWTMHRLIQDIVLQTLSEEKRSQRLKQIFRLWHQQLPQLQGEDLPTRLRLAGQIRHLVTKSEAESAFFDPLKKVNEAADICAWAANVFWEQHLVGLAERLLRRALGIWQQTLGDTNPRVANILANLATMNRALKNYVDAETFAHRAVVSKSSSLGINHPDVLLLLDQLGQLYAEQRKHKEARQCYEKALTIAEQVNLTSHPIYNDIRYDLALLNIEQKNWSRAKELLTRVSIGRRAASGANAIQIRRKGRYPGAFLVKKDYPTIFLTERHLLMTSSILHELGTDKSLQQLPLPVLEEIYPRDLVRQVLDEVQGWEQRERTLPHLFMVYLLIAWTLSPLQALRRVCAQLTSCWRWLEARRWVPLPSASALSYRRQTLGVSPLRLLLRLACKPLCSAETPGAFRFGRRLIAIDSKLFDVAESPQTDWTFRGRTRQDEPRRHSPFPQLRLLSALEIGSHAHMGAVIAAGYRAEMSLVNDLLSFVPADSLVLQDSGFRGAWWLQRLLEHGHHSITRVQSTDYPCRGARLPDGSYLVQTRGSSQARLAHPLTLRIIEYRLDPELAESLSQMQGSRAHSGTRPSCSAQQVYRLATTLLDHQQAPAREVATCYHERWELELVYDELQEHQLSTPRLQSKTCMGAIQEVWAMLLGHYAVRAWMMQAAGQNEALDGDRLSFTNALCVLGTALTLSLPLAAASTGLWKPRVLEDLRQGHGALPARRLRAYPRVVKVASTRFFVKKEKDLPWLWPDSSSTWSDFILPIGASASSVLLI